MTNNDIYNHNYTKCPLCGEPVSNIDRKCPVCEKNLVQQSYDDEEERIEESKKIISKLKNIKNEGIKNTLIVQYKKVLNLLIKVKTNLIEYVKSEDFKRHKLTALKVFILFVIFNIFLFWHVIEKETKNAPYPKARAYMAAAATVNSFYIFPIKTILGWNSPLAVPFYIIRDGLYDKGASLYPKGEGEKEIWWMKIKWNDYIHFDFSELIDYCQDNIHKSYSKRDISNFYKWEKELYSEIDLLSKAKITDPEYAKEKLSWFVDLADSTARSSRTIYYGEKYENPNPLFSDNKYIKEFTSVYSTYINLKEYSKKYEKDSYNYFFEKDNYKEAQLEFHISDFIIISKYNRDVLTCDEPFLKIYNDSHKILYDFYTHNEKKLYGGESIKLQLMLTGGISNIKTGGFLGNDYRMCSSLKDYVKYADKRMEDHKRYRENEKRIENEKIKKSNLEFERMHNVNNI